MEVYQQCGDQLLPFTVIALFFFEISTIGAGEPLTHPPLIDSALKPNHAESEGQLLIGTAPSYCTTQHTTYG